MRNFSAQETEWLEELDGIELASFWHRAFAFLIDWMIVAIVLSALVTAVAAGFFSYMQRHGKSAEDIAQMFPAAKLVNQPIGQRTLTGARRARDSNNCGASGLRKQFLQ